MGSGDGGEREGDGTGEDGGRSWAGQVGKLGKCASGVHGSRMTARFGKTHVRTHTHARAIAW